MHTLVSALADGLSGLEAALMDMLGTAAGAGRRRVALALDAPAVQAVALRARERGLAEDTPHAAAWSWAAARWMGRTAGTEGPGCGAWLDQAERLRRAGAEAAARLRLVFTPGPQPALALEHDDALLDPHAALAVLEAVAGLAAALVDAPADAPLDSLPLLPPPQQDRLLNQWNQPVAPADPSATVHGLFAQQVRLHPEAIALTDAADGSRLTYAELDHRAGCLAAGLRAAGVQAGERVGVALGRSAAAVVSVLGILKAGAAYFPLEAGLPAERLAFMLRDGQVRHVIARAGDTLALPAQAEVLDVDALCAGPAPAADAAAGGEAVAYVMYTSGSTGTPKGIEISHRAILRLVVDAQYVDLPRFPVVLHAAPLGFDASTLEIWGPLLHGGECVVHDETVPTGPGLRRTIAHHGVQTAWLTAGLFNAVVDDDPAHLAGLRQLLTGGEALSVPHVRRALDALPDTTLFNGYGPTECTTFAAVHRIPRELPADARSVPIGRPISHTVLRVLGPSLELLPPGCVGELCIGGRGLAHGYLGRPDLTAERFVDDPWGAPGERLYRTGDHARWLPDGTVEFVGRIDGQVKIRGHRIEVGEIEAALLAHPAVRSCAVVPRQDAQGQIRLVAYLVAQGEPAAWPVLRAHLAATLPEPMIPSAQVWLAELPVTPNGKLDRRALPAPSRQRPEMAQPYEEARSPAEQQVCDAFAQVLELDAVGRNDNFFDLGGDSLRVLRVIALLQPLAARPLTTTLLFQDPTPRAIAPALAPADAPAPAAVVRRAQPDALEPIALVGMAGRFPGAADVEGFWDNLLAGRETITFFDDAALDAGVSAALRADPAYVRARGVIDGVEDFDAAFFGINPKEAQLMDPQQRLFLEICWECLERAGYVPDQAPGSVGVYAGMYNASYFQRHVATRPDLIEAVGEFQVMLANEKDYITTRAANRLNLTGPAVSVHTACSTSLVAIATAFHALRSHQCDMALAGGVSITCPPRSGYLYQEGSMLSPDGHTRSFDTNAQGTVFSDGAGVVLLKRLSDAQRDGDTIYAVLRGAAINNDGGAKASFTAPSVDGQVRMIESALACAGVPAASISYLEAHGTATPMGDPIEVEGLARTYGRHAPEAGRYALGSLKSNVGHMVIAAGVGATIKTALALHEEALPPSLHFTAPNPAMDLDGAHLRVNDRLTPWPRVEGRPRRAGISAMGVGGTNAHLIVEEAPEPPPSEEGAGAQMLVLSARTPTALAAACVRLADHLERHGASVPLADVAHTLRVGRKAFAHRACVAAADPAGAVAALRATDSPWRAVGAPGTRLPQCVFMFPGQGAQYAGMGRGLHAQDALFRAALDECLAAFEGVTDFDLREKLFSDDPEALAPTAVTQPATFAVEYALARRALALGLQPAALVGHSVGEFAAAVIAGVMDLADAARLVARRGALMQALPPGDMLSVRLPAQELLPLLPEGVSLAGDNGPTACVAAGPADAVEALRAELERRGVAARLLQTSHAFHSAMMDPAVEPFTALVRTCTLCAPALPIHSTLTGRPLAAEEATDPAYWGRHLRGTVRFSPAVRALLDTLAQPVFVELGPRSTLATLVRQHAQKAQPVQAVAVLGSRPDDEDAAFKLAAGRLWTLGAEIDLGAFDTRQRKRRVRLPTYPFERKRFWVDIAPAAAPAAAAVPPPAAFADAVPLPVPTEPSMTASTAATSSRTASLDARLRTLFEDISGIDMGDVDSAAPFVEIGLDSLTLTQAALQVKKSFQVNLSFRQLMESYRSFEALAAFLDATLPPEAAPAQPAAPAVQAAPAMTLPQNAPAPVLPAMQAVPAAAGGTLVQQVIAQQMQLMQQQLALLSAAPSVPASLALPVPTVEQSTHGGSAAAPASNTAPAPVAAAAADEEPARPIQYDVKKAFGAIARIHTQSKEPTERQKARLNAFMRRYVERTAKSKAFTQDNRAHMADPRVVNGFRPATKEITYQIVIERSKGSRLWDLDGNEYVDVLNGFGMNLFGWQPDFVQEAVRKQLDLGYEIGPQHPLAAEVTQRICELTGFDRAALCNTGSEAVMAAVRIARTVTGRNTVVVFSGAYHGTFDEVLVRAGRQAKGLPAAPGIMPGMFGDVRVLDYGTPESLEYIRTHADDLAAVLTEPVQSRRPDFQPREFLREVRAITEKSGICLIFDEVITGFRSHLGGAQALFGIRADLASYGKVIGGGFPVGVIAGKREYMDALDGGAWQYGDDSIPTVGVTYFAGTFVRHPLALAACKASLDHLKQAGEGLQTQLNLHTAALADELTAYCREVGAPIEIRHFASLWRVTWLEDHPLQDLLFAMMRSRGVHILDNFPCFLTTAHTHDDIATIKSAFKAAVAELQEAEFIPRKAPAQSGFDAARPPVPHARLGRDKDGQPAWFVPDPAAPGKFKRVEA
ncbi:type I polyketide synthase [Xenophilus azovorans]|uniref:type I polyketide synthase n=1 Tax=Xenophilus azovorans TaxID=151755 RepID=UPI00068A7399|nr:type I polyketide synthase [Xenophilus azovorans]